MNADASMKVYRKIWRNFFRVIIEIAFCLRESEALYFLDYYHTIHENNRFVNKLIFSKRVTVFLLFVCWKLYHWTGFEVEVIFGLFFIHVISGIKLLCYYFVIWPHPSFYYVISLNITLLKLFLISS